jgi:hypothetical protein
MDNNIEDSKKVLELLKIRTKSFNTNLDTLKRIFENSAEIHTNIVDCLASVDTYFEQRNSYKVTVFSKGSLISVAFSPSGEKISQVRREVIDYGLLETINPQNLYISANNKFTFHIQF